MAIFSKLVFPTTSTIKAKYAIAPDPFGCALFDVASNDFILKIQPPDYQIRTEQTVSVSDGFTTPTINILQRRYVVDVTVRDGRSEITYVLEELMRNAYQNGVFTSITMYDYVNPEKDDVYSTGYTIRQGYLVVEPLGGSISATDQGEATTRRYGIGTKFTFSELTRRAW